MKLKLLILPLFLLSFTYLCAQNDDAPKILQNKYEHFRQTYYLGDQKIKRKAFVGYLKEQPVAYDQFKLGRTFNRAGKIIALGGIGSLIYGLSQWELIGDSPKSPFVIGGVGLLVGLVFNYLGQRTIEKSIEVYNDSYSIDLKINGNNIGLVLQF